MAQETLRDSRLRLRTFGGLSLTAQDGKPLPDAANLRRPLALLALLAVAGHTGMSRDKLCSFISPESDADHSRNTLKQTVFRLRRASREPEIIFGTTELRLNPAVVSSDVSEFLDATRLRNLAHAAELYVGPFLDGVYLRDAPEFSRWVEVERGRLRDIAEHVLRDLADKAAARGNHSDAAQWWRRLAELRPADGFVALSLMRSLAYLGERSKALEHARSHTAYVRSQLEEEPDPAVARLAEELRHPASGTPSPELAGSGGAGRSTEAREIREQQTPLETPVALESGIAKPPGSRRFQPRNATIWLAPTVLAIALLAGIELRRQDVSRTENRSIALTRIDGMSSSSDETCVVRGGRIFCWGRNDEGQLGNGSIRDAAIAVIPVSNGRSPLHFIEVTTNAMHGCGLSAEAIAYCWGQNSEGQLGVPSLPGSALPVRVAGEIKFRALSAGSYHTCGIALDNSIYCWGWNNYGQLGNPSGKDKATSPVPVAGSLSFSAVSSNYLHSCALTLTGMAYCWGSNVEGQLGIGSSRTSAVPALVTDARSFSQIVTGSNHSCAVDVSGEAFCWGYNAFGQLGSATSAKCGRAPYQVPCSPQPLPVRTNLRFTRLGTGQFHTCGLVATGEAYCWGRNDKGQLGDGTFSHSFSPVQVAGGLRFLFLAGGANHTCGVAVTERVYCWGANDRGQLGDGTSAASAAPVEVVLNR